MTGIIGAINELYIRFLVWLGAAPPPGYEYLVREEAGPTQYTLKEGETLFSVARKFGVHYEVLAKANQIEEPKTVGAGQTLFIPPAGWQPAPEIEPEVPAAPVEPAAPAPAAVVEPEAQPVPEVVVAPPPLEPVEEQPVAPSGPMEVVAEQPPVEAEPEVELPPFETAPVEVAPPVAPPAAPERPAVEEPRPPVEPETAFRYELQRGDTLSSVARRYNVTVQELIDANEIANPNLIFPGQKLIIPRYLAPKPPAPAEPAPPAPPEPPRVVPGEFFTYTIAVGDTLAGIAKRYGVSVAQLIEANKIDNPNILRVGQRLVIPGMVPAPAAPVAPPRPAVRPAPLPLTGLDPKFPPIGPLDAIRGLYLSYFAVAHPDLRQHTLHLLETTEFNTLILDVKGDSGWLSYPTQVPVAREIGADRPIIQDFDDLIADLKARGVYTIARIVTFKDSPLARSLPELAVSMTGGPELWVDRDESYWVDPFLKPVWDYNIAIAVEAAEKGFDEIQFDAVRFPTASQAGQPQFSQEATKETRVAAITGFLSMARGQLRPFGVKLAANTLGYTCWRKDDTLIGQDIDRLGQHVDVLCPKLYPSAFGSGIPGYKMAVAYPYEVVYHSARQAVERVSRLGCAVRPWIQDFPDNRFDKRVYGRDDIQAQIKGGFDAGCTGFMVWNPNGNYTEGAYAPVTGRS